VKKYEYLVIDKTVTVNENVNLTFVAMANKLYIYTIRPFSFLT